MDASAFCDDISTLNIPSAPLVAKFRTGVRAIQLVGRASESLLAENFGLFLLEFKF